MLTNSFRNSCSCLTVKHEENHQTQINLGSSFNTVHFLVFRAARFSPDIKATRIHPDLVQEGRSRRKSLSTNFPVGSDQPWPESNLGRRVDGDDNDQRATEAPRSDEDHQRIRKVCDASIKTFQFQPEWKFGGRNDDGQFASLGFESRQVEEQVLEEPTEDQQHGPEESLLHEADVVDAGKSGVSTTSTARNPRRNAERVGSLKEWPWTILLQLWYFKFFIWRPIKILFSKDFCDKRFVFLLPSDKRTKYLGIYNYDLTTASVLTQTNTIRPKKRAY